MGISIAVGAHSFAHKGKNKLAALVVAIFLLQFNCAFALGLGDLIGGGISVVGKIGGAMIDKAMEDSPEERERKQLKEKADREAKFHEANAKIEARTDLTPLQKEKLTRQVSKAFGMADTINNLAVLQDARRREQRDQMLSVGGIAGVVGNAALSTPSAVMARADLAVKLGIPQAQSGAAIEGADALMRTGHPLEQSRSTVAAADAILAGSTPQPIFNSILPSVSADQRSQIGEAIQTAQTSHQAEVNDAAAAVEAAKPKELLAEPEPTNLVSYDAGRKIFVEFVSGKKLSERLQQAFRERGFNVTESASDAEVVYQLDGEYQISAENNSEAVVEHVGAFTDNPHVIEAPQQKSNMKRAVGGFFAAMAGVTVRPQSSSGLKQGVLVVANRHADGYDTRVSALIRDEGAKPIPDVMIENALLNLMGVVGVDISKTTEGNNSNIPAEKNI